MKQTTKFLKACSLSVALAASVALVAGISLPDVAFAEKGGNGNGNGGGNGNGNGNSGGNGNGNGNSAKADKSSGTSTTAKSEKPAAKSAKKSATKKAKKPSLADELGVSASELGALNAAHASPNALKNASPNSRVGRIAAYRDAVVAGQELQDALDEKQAALDGLTAPTRSLEEIQADLDLADDDVATQAALVDQLEADLEAANGEDPVIEGLLEEARIALGDAEGVQAGFADEKADAIAYETLSDEVADLEDQLEDQPELERSLLEAAANKPVTDAVEAAVRQLLGL